LHDVCYASAPQWYPYASGLLRQAWYRRSAVGADAILTDSEFSRREILRVYQVRPEKVHTIYPGVDHRRFCRFASRDLVCALRDRYSIPQDFLLFVGDVHRRRNLGRVIEALHQVKASDSSLRRLELVVIGRTVELPAIANHSDVRYLGYVPDADLPAFYKTAQVLVYPSFYEGFGFPILEAMACGCPVIVSCGTACEETAGDAGLKVQPASVRSIAEAVTALMQNRELAGRCAEAGLARAAKFDWRKAAMETREVYLRVLRTIRGQVALHRNGDG
jgi:glycosyltransferase involved in cell wall biosynthesis